MWRNIYSFMNGAAVGGLVIVAVHNFPMAWWEYLVISFGIVMLVKNNRR